MTNDEIKTALGGVTVSDEELAFVRSAAELRIERDGVGENAREYDVLLVYAIGSALLKRGSLLAGVGGSAAIKKEKVADVEVEYAGVDASGGGTSNAFEDEYVRTLRNAVGLTHRLVP